MAKRTQKKKSKKARGRRGTEMVLSRNNYFLLIVGVALIAFGFAIMRFENEVDGFISLYVAPLIIIAGYGEIAYAILKKPEDSSNT